MKIENGRRQNAGELEIAGTESMPTLTAFGALLSR